MYTCEGKETVTVFWGQKDDVTKTMSICLFFIFVNLKVVK